MGLFNRKPGQTVQEKLAEWVPQLTLTDKLLLEDIYWERIFLHMAVLADFDEEPEFFLVRYNRKANTIHEMNFYESVPISYKERDGHVYMFCLNIAAINGRTFLDNGNWILQCRVPGQEDAYTVMPTYDVAYHLEDKCRIFRYGGGTFSYDISVDTFTQGQEIVLAFHSHFMIENKGWKKRQWVREVKGFPRKVKRFRKASIRKGVNIVYQILATLHHNTGKNVMFMSETRGTLWGNLKAINDRMIERGLDKEFHITYNIRKAVGNKAGLWSWIKTVAKIAQQDYIFVDDYTPVFGHIKLQKNTKLIQLWHAGEGFKAVGYCRFGKGGPYPIETCHKEYDYVVVGSKKLIHTFEEVFGIEEEAFLPVGMARLDGFLDPEYMESCKKTFYEQYPMAKGKKLILFAPTFRGGSQKVAYYPKNALDLKRVYEFLGDEYIWAFKMHPFIKDPVEIPEEYKDRMIDLSEWMNINDLYYVTDLLITDYSSNFYEYALMERPVLFYTFDRENYELTRGVHRSVKDNAPGKVCDSFDEMMEALKNKDFEEEKIHQFVKDNFSEYDGHASDRVIDTILLGKNHQ